VVLVSGDVTTRTGRGCVISIGDDAVCAGRGRGAGNPGQLEPLGEFPVVSGGPRGDGIPKIAYKLGFGFRSADAGFVGGFVTGKIRSCSDSAFSGGRTLFMVLGSESRATVVLSLLGHAGDAPVSGSAGDSRASSDRVGRLRLGGGAEV
jgi:hypothetical protein